MASLRDFIGARCPRCTRDILQQAPSQNRMPTDHAWCPSCQAVMSLEELTAPRAKGGGLLRKLFGGKPNHL
jgi:hypothetical protein